jgi:hypothetical protein
VIPLAPIKSLLGELLMARSRNDNSHAIYGEDCHGNPVWLPQHFVNFVVFLPRNFPTKRIIIEFNEDINLHGRP